MTGSEFATLGSSAGMGYFDAWYNNRSAMDRQHDAQDFSKEMFNTRYQNTVKDLLAAGLNPMLAYGHGPGSAPSGTVASPAGKGMDITGAVNTTRLATAQEGAIRSQEAKNIQDTRTGAATERNIDADTLIKAGMPSLIAAQVVQATASAEQSKVTADRIRAEIPKIEQEINHLRSQVDKNRSDVSLNASLEQANTYLNALRTAEAYLVNARIRVTNLEGDILDPKAKAARTNTAELGHVADNIGKIGSAAWKFMFPTLSSPSDATRFYP